MRLGNKFFRFEAMCVRENACTSIIEQVWADQEGGDSMEQILQLNINFGTKLQHWNKTSFGNVQKCLWEASIQLHQAQDSTSNQSQSCKVKKARENFHIWLEREELL